MNNLNNVVKKKTIAQWQSYIGTSLRKTADATLDTAKRVAEYKLAVAEAEFNKSMKEWFGMSPSHLSYWAKINEQLPRFVETTAALPASSRTLYELAGLDDSLWDELVETGDINPAVTVEGAKNLKVNGGIRKATMNQYGEADNFLEIMQKLDELMHNATSVTAAKKALKIWLKENPPQFYEEEDEEVLESSAPATESPAKPTTKEIKGTSSQLRVKCLGMFGIFVDKPIIDKEFLTFLDRQAGSDESKLAAIATLESE